MSAGNKFSLNSLRGESGNLPDQLQRMGASGVFTPILAAVTRIAFENGLKFVRLWSSRGKDRRNPEASFEFSRMLQERALTQK